LLLFAPLRASLLFRVRFQIRHVGKIVRVAAGSVVVRTSAQNGARYW
jgi:hypothetical protein